jgi:hypothetical protein
MYGCICTRETNSGLGRYMPFWELNRTPLTCIVAEWISTSIGRSGGLLTSRRCIPILGKSHGAPMAYVQFAISKIPFPHPPLERRDLCSSRALQNKPYSDWHDMHYRLKKRRSGNCRMRSCQIRHLLPLPHYRTTSPSIRVPQAR